MRTTTCVLVLFLAIPVRAATLNVPAQYPTIQAAIDAAVDGDDVVVAPGTYNEAIDFLGKAITVRSSDGPRATTIDASGLDTSVVRFVTDEGPESVLQGFTVTGGTGSVSYPYDSVGGGILVIGSSPMIQVSRPTIADCVVHGNSASHGSAMYLYSAIPNLANCQFHENVGPDQIFGVTESGLFVTSSTFDGSGKAIFLRATEHGGELRITASEFRNYTTAIWNFGHADFVVTDCVFEDGGTAIETHASTLSVTDCEFHRNATGAVFAASDVVATRCTFANNTAGPTSPFHGLGGAINCDGHSLRAVDCTFLRNTGGGGGAIYAFDPTGVPGLYVVRSLFLGNTAEGQGGAILGSAGVGDDDTIADCVFVGNSAEYGGALCWFHYLDFPVSDCTFSGNDAVAGRAFAFWGSVGDPFVMRNCILWDGPSEIHSLDGSSVALVAYSDVSGGYAGDGNIDADPLFLRNPSDGGDGWGDDPDTRAVDEGANDDYGDLRLLSGSPCIDAAENAAVPADILDLDGDGDTAEPLPLDLRGRPRFADITSAPDLGAGTPPLVDMGAYESQELHVPADYATIQAAIDAAEPGDTVLVAPGTYVECIDFLGKAIVVRSVSGPADTTIVACGEQGRAIVTCAGGEQVLTTSLEGFTITMDPNVGWSYIMWVGNDHDGGVTVRDCVFTDVQEEAMMWLEGTFNLRLVDCVFQRLVVNDYGGLILGIDQWGGSLVIERCGFYGVPPFDWLMGAAVYVIDSTCDGAPAAQAWPAYCVLIDGCTFRASPLGIRGPSPTLPPATVTNSSFSECSNTWGGAIWARGFVCISECEFTKNRGRSGGAIALDSGRHTIVGCRFSGNVAEQEGGAIYPFGWGGGTTTVNLHDCTFVGNTAGIVGGAIAGESSDSWTLTNCTFAGNQAPTGRAVSLMGLYHPDSISNCVMRDGGDEIVAEALAGVTYSDVQGGWPGTGNIDADPLFVRNPSDGGDGWGDDPNTPDVDEGANDDFGDLRLLSGSPCIDAGDPSFVPAPGQTDFDGRPRVRDGNGDGVVVVDMGAYEFGLVGPPIVASPTAATLRLVDPGTDHPAVMEHAVYEETTARYVGASGRLVAEPFWQPMEAWIGVQVRALTASTEYRFMAKARDASGNETPFGPIAAISTTRAGDVDGDDAVNQADLTLVQQALGTQYGDPGFDARADLNGDDKVTFRDVGIVRRSMTPPKPQPSPAAQVVPTPIAPSSRTAP